MRLWNVLLALFVLTCAGWAETVRFDATRQDVVYEARGQDIEIVGDHGSVVIDGSAHRVVIDGHHQDVVVSEAAEIVLQGHHMNVKVARVGALTLVGHHNDVIVTDCQPAVSDLGGYNSVVSSMGVVAPEGSAPVDRGGGTELVLSGAARNETLRVDGRDVIIEGSANRFSLLGRPISVTVTGAMNTVDLEETTLIVVNGTSNSVTYKSGRPRIENTGIDNSVSGP